jgi:hypothetical protein
MHNEEPPGLRDTRTGIPANSAQNKLGSRLRGINESRRGAGSGNANRF